MQFYPFDGAIDIVIMPLSLLSVDKLVYVVRYKAKATIFEEDQAAACDNRVALHRRNTYDLHATIQNN